LPDRFLPYRFYARELQPLSHLERTLAVMCNTVWTRRINSGRKTDPGAGDGNPFFKKYPRFSDCSPPVQALPYNCDLSIPNIMPGKAISFIS
jgi:hypothetical protein